MVDITEIEIAAWHEAAHACVGLRLKQIPQLIEIADDGSGKCRFQKALSGETALLIGMAGELVCEEMLGIPGTASPQDVALAQPHWERLFASGRRDRVQQHVIRQASRLCWDLKPQIECLADKLMKSRRIDIAKLGSLCRTFQPLAQFKGMFPRPKPQPVATVRRRPMSHQSQISHRMLRRASMSAGQRIIERLIQGHGRLPAGVSRAGLISDIRQCSGSR